MSRLRMSLQIGRLEAQTILGRSTPLFHTLARLGSGRAALVTQDTGLCIEAPPASGNTFFTTGFALCNPNVSLAHHHHVPAQVHKALRLGVPVVTLLRNPIDCALSRAASANKPFLVGTILRNWLAFWHGSSKVVDAVVVARFEDVISDPGGVVDRINAHWATDFSSELPQNETILATLKERRAVRQIPSDERLRKKEQMLQLGQAHPLANRALRLYDDLESKLPHSGG